MTHYITTTTSTPCAIDNSGDLFTHGTASFARVVLKNGAIISMPMGHIRVEGTPAQLAEVAHLVSDDYVSLSAAVAAFGGAAPAVETATVETTAVVATTSTVRFNEITLACGAVISMPMGRLTFKGTPAQEQHFADLIDARYVSLEAAAGIFGLRARSL